MSVAESCCGFNLHFSSDGSAERWSEVPQRKAPADREISVPGGVGVCLGYFLIVGTKYPTFTIYRSGLCGSLSEGSICGPLVKGSNRVAKGLGQRRCAQPVEGRK